MFIDKSLGVAAMAECENQLNKALERIRAPCVPVPLDKLLDSTISEVPEACQCAAWKCAYHAASTPVFFHGRLGLVTSEFFLFTEGFFHGRFFFTEGRFFFFTEGFFFTVLPPLATLLLCGSKDVSFFTEDFFTEKNHGKIFHGRNFHGKIFHGRNFHGKMFHGRIFHGSSRPNLTAQDSPQRSHLAVSTPGVVDVPSLLLALDPKSLCAGLHSEKRHGLPASQSLIHWPQSSEVFCV